MTPPPGRDPWAGFPGGLLRRGEPGWETYRGDVIYRGDPDAVARPGSEAELADLLRLAADRGIGVTFSAGRSGLTGAGAADDGLLVSCERMNRLLDVGRDPETGHPVAVAEPGIPLAAFQRALAAEGHLYPPDPTSREEALLGGTVATNATGEDTLLYGPTRRWIRELRVVTVDGEVRTLRRPAGHRPAGEKATPGIHLDGSPVDPLIGSEGILAAVTRVTVDLAPLPHDVFAGLAFFGSLEAALRFVVGARRAPGLRPRALELLDRASLDLVADNPEGVRWPHTTAAAILFKEELGEGEDRDARLGAWLDVLAAEEPDRGLVDATLLFAGGRDRERLRRFRHRVPATLHEIANRYRDAGGGKVGTDWWVPHDRLPDMLPAWRDRLAAAGHRFLVFGHVGNGHPHVNFIAADGAERARAAEHGIAMCRDAVALGGGVAGEHGLGKLKRDLFAIQHPDPRVQERQRSIKREWDPRGILGRGTLFPPEAA